MWVRTCNPSNGIADGGQPSDPSNTAEGHLHVRSPVCSINRTEFRAQQTKPFTQGCLALSPRPTNLSNSSTMLGGRPSGRPSCFFHPPQLRWREPWLYEAATSRSRYWRVASRTNSARDIPCRDAVSSTAVNNDSLKRALTIDDFSPATTGA